VDSLEESLPTPPEAVESTPREHPHPRESFQCLRAEGQPLGEVAKIVPMRIVAEDDTFPAPFGQVAAAPEQEQKAIQRMIPPRAKFGDHGLDDRVTAVGILLEGMNHSSCLAQRQPPSAEPGYSVRVGELLRCDLLAQFASVDILGRISRNSQRLSGIIEIVAGACLEGLPGGEGDFHVDNLTAKAG
jgi:hypothetical protein